MPVRVADDHELSDRLVSVAREARRLWRAHEALGAIEAAIVTQEVADDLIREAVGEARAAGTRWEEIARTLGASRQAAWQKFKFADDTALGTNSTETNQPGRQAYFRDLVVDLLKARPDGEASVEELYKLVPCSADPGWVDDAPCRHNKAQREWQHDLRWSLLQLKASGAVRHARRGTYALA